jgi:hypothetical protein
MDRHDRSTTFDSESHADDTQAHKVGTVVPLTTQHRAGVIWNPNAVQSDDNEVCIWKAVSADITISRLEITLDAAGNEVAGDLKYADAFISLANPVVINAFDTTNGILDDSSITVGAVPSGKAVYFSFDSAPNAAITQMFFDITYTFD